MARRHFWTGLCDGEEGRRPDDALATSDDYREGLERGTVIRRERQEVAERCRKDELSMAWTVQFGGGFGR